MKIYTKYKMYGDRGSIPGKEQEFISPSLLPEQL
jgi:hypothetical protein